MLRAWERRYQILDPERTPGGFRLYSDADVARVELMQRHLATGLAPAQAADRARAEMDAAPATAFEGDPIAELRTALEGFDEAAAHRVIDHILATFELESVITNIVFPYLRDLGDRWEAGEITVAQEHFASRVLRSRLIGRGRGWDDGTGPRAVLACGPNELHDLPLVCLGLALRERGWRITLLGIDTPIDTVISTVGVLHPDLTVIAFTIGADADRSRPVLADLALHTRLTLAGPGVDEAFARAVGARHVNGDPVTVARRLTSERDAPEPGAAARARPSRTRARRIA